MEKMLSIGKQNVVGGLQLIAINWSISLERTVHPSSIHPLLYISILSPATWPFCTSIITFIIRKLSPTQLFLESEVPAFVNFKQNAHERPVAVMNVEKNIPAILN